MSRQVKFRRGTEAQHEAFTGAVAEVTVNTTDHTLHVHDGVTPGGHKITGGSFGFYNVKDWGAKGDGSTDDYAAIQAALTELAAPGAGGTLVFPPGTYKISQKLIVPDPGFNVSQLVLQGSGKFSTFLTVQTPFTGDSLIQINASTDIRGFTFSGTETPIWAIRNKTTGANIMSFIEDNQFILFRAPGGAYINENMGTYMFSKNIVGSCGTAVYNYNWGTNAFITWNTVLADVDAIVLSNNGNSNEGIILHGNIVGSVAGDGLVISHGLDIQVTDNEFTPIQAYGSGKRGIRFSGSSGPVRVKGNWIEGLIVDNVSLSNLTIKDNYFANGSACVLIGDVPGAVYQVQIMDNQFDGNAAGALINIQNCSNVDIAYNDASRGNALAGCFESGGSDIRWTHNRFSTGAGSFSAGSKFAFNTGSSGYTNTYSL